MWYPADWREFEDAEGTFLFYNPDRWTGNFRISAFKGNGSYGSDCIRQELATNRSAALVNVGRLPCAYSRETFEEGGARYTVHFWLAGIGDTAFECSFTVPEGASPDEAREVVASLEMREGGKRYPAEVIPIRLSEICQINEAYGWVSSMVKERLKKDFQGVEADVPLMQQMMEESGFTPKKREAWRSLGIALCVIVANEVDGMEWRTLIDGNREDPILLDVGTGSWIDPMKLVWSKVKSGQTVDLVEIYKSLF